MIPQFLSRLWWRRFLAREGTSWRDLEEYPKLSPGEQRAEMARRLLAQIQYFGRRADAFPEWREAASITDPDDLWRVWPSLPIMTRSDLQNRFPASEMAGRFQLQGRLNSSGGSTGEPVRFFHDWQMVYHTLAASTYSRIRMGAPLGMPTIILWGSDRDIARTVSRKSRLLGELRNEHVLGGYGLTDEKMEQTLKLIHANRPVAIYGFTSIMEFVAQRVVASGRIPPAGSVRTAWNGGEMLFEHQVRVFQQAFGVPILNRYGGRELSVMACQFGAGEPLLVMRPWLYLEIVNREGKPCAPGEMGRLIWTSTICRGTPFLRYEVGDMGASNPRQHDESGISAMGEISGRIASVMELPSGKTINNLYWNHLFKEYGEVQQFQVLVKKNGSLEISLKGDRLSAERDASLRNLLRQFLEETPVEFRWVEQIPLTSQGKLIQVVRERA